MRTGPIAAATLLTLAGTVNAQLAEWDNNIGGSWNDPANWSPMFVPNASTFTASIATPGSYDVFLNVSLTIGTLSMTNPTASVTVEFGDALTITNGVTNNGEIVINNNAAGAVTTLFMQGINTPLTGTGSLRLNGFLTRARLIASPGFSIVHGADHTIEGFGVIDAAMTNNGLIDANIASQTLELNNQPIANTGTMQATNNGILNMNALTVTQSPAGRIVADGGTVLIGSCSIAGGTLDTINAGVMNVDVASDFDAVTVAGDLLINFGSRINVANGLTNNAQLTVNNAAAGAVTLIDFQDAGTLGGTGSLLLNGFDARAQLLANNGTIVHEAPHTIRGHGRMTGAIDNRSTVVADINNQSIFLLNSDITNTGVLRGTSGGTLDIDNTTIANAGGVVSADGGTVLYGNVTLSGGTVQTVNGGNSIINVASSFEGVAVQGDLTLNFGTTLTVSNSMTNNGLLTVNNNAAGAVTVLAFADSSTLGGSGTLLLNGVGTRAQLTTAAGQTMTHQAPHQIRGFGRINASLVNNSTISADRVNQVIAVDNSAIDNNALLQALADSTLDLNNSTIENQGGVIRADEGTVRMSGVSVNGGSIEAVSGGVMLIDGSSAFDAVTIQNDLGLGFSTTLAITNGLVNNSTLTVNTIAAAAVTSLRFDDNSTLDGTGTVVLNGFTSRARLLGLNSTVTATQAPTHTIEGEGQIDVALINNGTIAPGFPGLTPIREMLANSDITNTASAHYIVEVQGNNNSDLIDSTGAYHAAGTLTVEFINTFDPADYWGTSIIQADGGVTGRYDTIVAPVPTDPRLTVRARYLPNEIRVGAVCKPDINFDGMLNFFDISAFISLYNVQDPDADISAPFGVWNFFDIATYISQYNSGCP